jgi:hypothetical protein
MPPQMTYRLPEGVVYAKPGNYVLCRKPEGSYRVYQVQDMYLVERLLPVETTLGGTAPEFVAHSLVAASAEPQIRYLVNEFEKTFPSRTSAIESIAQRSLGPNTPERYLDVLQFMSSNCEVLAR